MLTIESSVVDFSIIQIQCYHLDRNGDGATVIFLSDGRIITLFNVTEGSGVYIILL